MKIVVIGSPRRVSNTGLIHAAKQAPKAGLRGARWRQTMVQSSRFLIVLAFLMTGVPFAQDAQVTQLISKELPECPGKEASMITVDYSPGASTPIHRHNAHAFVYMLEGTVVMQVKGGKEVTLTPGQTFYEGPNDIHLISRNASTTKPAKFVVFFVKNKGAPVLIPVK
jgi:quercetin dioxygenase-like cupin family protein